MCQAFQPPTALPSVKMVATTYRRTVIVGQRSVNVFPDTREVRVKWIYAERQDARE
jgi:hypothetical protein